MSRARADKATGKTVPVPVATGMVVDGQSTKAVGNHWVKGVSPNPGGLSRAHRELLSVVREHATPQNVAAVMDRILDLALHSAEERVSLEASREYLNRAVGKPLERKQDVPPDLAALSDEQMDKVFGQLGYVRDAKREAQS